MVWERKDRSWSQLTLILQSVPERSLTLRDCCCCATPQWQTCFPILPTHPLLINVLKGKFSLLISVLRLGINWKTTAGPEWRIFVKLWGISYCETLTKVLNRTENSSFVPPELPRSTPWKSYIDIIFIWHIFSMSAPPGLKARGWSGGGSGERRWVLLSCTEVWVRWRTALSQGLWLLPWGFIKRRPRVLVKQGLLLLPGAE